nr:hypothetical protein [uncultured Pseudoxanthomonas sp.]
MTVPWLPGLHFMYALPLGLPICWITMLVMYPDCPCCSMGWRLRRDATHRTRHAGCVQREPTIALYRFDAQALDRAFRLG